jgi:hypothetical protein
VQQVGGGGEEKLPVHHLANRIVQLQAILVGGLFGLPGTDGFHLLLFTGLTLSVTAIKPFLASYSNDSANLLSGRSASPSGDRKVGASVD